MNTGITLDYEEAMKKLIEETLEKDPVLLVKSMHTAGNQLKIDADDIPPRTPHDKGPLRASGKVNVTIEGNEITGNVSYDMAYAAIQHENEEFHHPEEGTGAKYLESKLVNLNKKYLDIMAQPLMDKYK